MNKEIYEKLIWKYGLVFTDLLRSIVQKELVEYSRNEVSREYLKWFYIIYIYT